MSNIPTADEILSKYSDNYKIAPFKDRASVNGKHAIEAMMEFAKLHVQAALESASNKVDFDWKNNPSMDTHGVDIDKNSILNAYPLNLIK